MRVLQLSDADAMKLFGFMSSGRFQGLGQVTPLGKKIKVDAADGHSHLATLFLSGDRLAGWTTSDAGHLHVIDMAASVPKQTGGKIVTFIGRTGKTKKLHVHPMTVPDLGMVEARVKNIPGFGTESLGQPKTTTNEGHNHTAFVFRNGPDRISFWTSTDDGHFHLGDFPIDIVKQFKGMMPTFQGRNKSDGVEHLHFVRVKM